METFKKISSIVVFPGLTAVTAIVSLIIVANQWNATCDDHSNTLPHVWLVTYIVCCIPGFFLALYGAFGMSLKGSNSGPAGGAAFILFGIFLLGTLIWCITGCIMLFGYYNCFSNPMAIMMLIDIIYH